MPVKLKWPWLGIAIPSFLIASIGYCAHYFILLNFLSLRKQLWYQFCQTMIWLSYYLAIYTPPGKPPTNFKPSKNEWKVYCKKCKCYKPERSHHCKTCNQCVLMMDHHCPWTMNCVGYNNFPHFIRFLFWVIVGTTSLAIFLTTRIHSIWVHRSSPSYLYYKSELIFLTILTPLNAFILLTISILMIRCLFNQIFNGRSQIESWEMDRLETLARMSKLLPILIENVWYIFPNLRNEHVESQAEALLNKKRLSLDELVNFPYDLGPFRNAIQLLGTPPLWLYPFSGPQDDGLHFQKNEESMIEDPNSLNDIILCLPWPPDSTKHLNSTSEHTSNVQIISEEGEQVIRIRTSEKKLSRSEWLNDWGESLEDFGVDVDVE